MDDLHSVSTLLEQPEPAPWVAARSRQRLLEHMRGARTSHRAARTRRRGGWLTPGVRAVAGATAAAVALVVAVTLVSFSGGRAPAPRLSARDMLLAAAATAQRAPGTTGAYWHVKTVSADGTPGTETWTAHNGRIWVRGQKTSGDLRELSRAAPFRLAGQAVSVQTLRDLPPDARALKAWIADAVAHGDARTSAGRPDAATRRRTVLASLTALVAQLPAPPAVRAAAFRALASLPHVERLGPVAGGQGLRISVGGRHARLVIDPATARVRRTSFYVTADGAEVWLAAGRTATVSSGWTDQRPG